MKNGLRCLIGLLFVLLLFLLVGHHLSQRHASTSLWPTEAESLRAARFLHPTLSQAALHQRQQIRRLRPADFTADVAEATRTEFQRWAASFHLGSADLQQRLQWQGLTESDLRAYIHQHLLDEAWLEQHLQRTAPPVTIAAARAWYQDQAENLRMPARHRVSHLFLSAHDPKKPDRQPEIRALHQRLLRGEPWAKLTAAHSEDERSRHRAGDLGWLSRERMPADFMTAVEAQPTGRPSPPIRTRLGWHLLRGEPWAKLTAAHSEDERSRHRAGDLGWLSRERMPADFMTAVEAQPTGRPSPPIRTRLGWHLLLITDRAPSRLPTLEEALPEIQAHLHQTQREAALKALLESSAAKPKE